MESHFLKTLNATIAASVFTVSSIFSTVSAFAATDGTIGATTTGIVNLNIVKPPVVAANSLNDVSLPSYHIGDGDKVIASPACVYSSTLGGGYTVQGVGSGAGGAFTVDDGASHVLPYVVIWNSGGAGALADSGISLTANVTSVVQYNAATDSATCSGAAPGSTAQINVHVLGTSLDTAPAGTYSGTLTFIITPA